MTKVKDIIEEGESIPADVTEVEDRHGHRWPTAEFYVAREFGPLTVTAVREPERKVEEVGWPEEADYWTDDADGDPVIAAVREPERCNNLPGCFVHPDADPQYSHEVDGARMHPLRVPESTAEPRRGGVLPCGCAADCPDCSCGGKVTYPESAPSVLLDLVRQYGDQIGASVLASECEGIDEAAQHERQAKAILDRIAALLPQQPVQALNGAGCPWWLHTCGAVVARSERPQPHACDDGTGPWRPLVVGGDPAPEQPDALDEARGDYEAARAKLREVVAERDAARAEVERLKGVVERLKGVVEFLNAEAERVTDALVKARAEAAAPSDPLVLSLPTVPDGAVALIGRSGRRFTRVDRDGPKDWWNAEEGRRSLVALLELEGSLTVVCAPRTWPKLDGAPGDLMRFKDASGKVWRRGDGGIRLWCWKDDSGVLHGFRTFAEIQHDDGPLTEVFDDEPGGELQ
jgi:hypothetical protein